jgi:membrane-bound ClpP family serine protease
MKDIILPILLITVGAAWLAHNMQWLPDISWFWIIGCFVAGIAIFAVEGVTKSSVVAAPMLMLLGLFSLLRQLFGVSWGVQMPVLLMVLGACLIVARLPAIPDRRRNQAKTAPPAAQLPAEPPPSPPGAQ